VVVERSEWIPKGDVVALDDVLGRSTSDSVEVLGFVHALIHDHRFRIEPSISQRQYVGFIKLYFERCLREDPQGEWASSRYIAGGEMVNVFGALWRDKDVPRELLAELRDWLGILYKSGDAKIRLCLVSSTIEHLFEQEPIRKFFENWKSDPILSVAYREASEWCLTGGNSPLGKPFPS